MEFILGLIAGFGICKSNDKWGWINKIVKKIKDKMKK
jgi:hypothetical protein